MCSIFIHFIYLAICILLQAAKLLEKLNVGGIGKEDCTSVQNSDDYSSSNAVESCSNFPRISREPSLYHPDFLNGKREQKADRSNRVHANGSGYLNRKGMANQNQFKEDPMMINKNPLMKSWLECQQCSRVPIVGNYLPQLGTEYDRKEEAQLYLEKFGEVLEEKASVDQKVEITRSPVTSEESSSHESLSTKGKIFECEINWEDLHLGDEIGQGKCSLLFFGLVPIYFAIFNM